MNRDKALTIADRIMTRIESDRAIHKDALADEIQAGDAIDEVVDIISHDGEKWVRRDGTAFDTDADQSKFVSVNEMLSMLTAQRQLVDRAYLDIMSDALAHGLEDFKA